jgi:phosphoesterase RecJ-like protein
MPSLKNVVDNAKKHQVPICVIDHHLDNELYGDLNLIAPYSAAATMLAEFAIETQLKITQETATCLLLGIIRDTGGFRFQNTDPKTMRLTAKLIELGGDYHGLTHKIFFSEELNRLKFISYVINHKLNFSSNGRVLHCILEDEEFNNYGVHKKDMEGLIDSIRTIKGVTITCIFTYWNEQIKLSMRSCDEKYPVDKIAHKIGGGGHRLAAGAKVNGTSFTPAVKQFLTITEEMFHG